MLTEKILSTLSCQRFLTLNEICKATNIDHLIGQQQLKKLEKDRLVERRSFAGRSYFKLTDVTKSTSDLGKKRGISCLSGNQLFKLVRPELVIII